MVQELCSKGRWGQDGRRSVGEEEMRIGVRQQTGLVLVGFIPGNTDTFSVFVNLCVSVLELLSKRRELAEQVSVWPQRWPLLVTGPAACPE